MIDGVVRGVGQRLGGVVADLRGAIALRPVQWGLAATTLLAVGSLTPAYLPQASPYWPVMRLMGLDNWWAKALGTALVIAAVGLLIAAWFRLRPTIYVDVKHWAVLAWWSLPLLFAPPIFSHDAYSYAAHGWLLHNGLNPYDTSPSVLPGAFADQVAWVWRYTPTPYGPLALQISHGLVLLAGLNPYYAAVLMRLPALLGVALIVHYLPRTAVAMGLDPRDTAWFSTINPLLVIDFVGGAHNDAVMMGLVVWALYLAHRGRFLAALVAVGVATAVKQPALLAAYPVAVIGSSWASWHYRDLLRFLPRVLFAFAVVSGVFVAITFASGLGFGWLNAMSVPGTVITLAPLSLLGWAAQSGLTALGWDDWARLALPVAHTLSAVIFVTVTCWLVVTTSRTQPVRFLSWSWIAFALFGPALHTWYLLWGGLLLPLTSPGRRLWQVAAWVTAVLLVYGAGNLAWRNDAVALALASVAAASIWLFLRYRTRRARAVHT